MQREVSAAAGVTRDEGLQELYERHAPAAGRLAYLLTGDRSLAEDLVQEAFVRLVGRPTPAGARRLLSGWTVALVSITDDLRNTYCIALNIDESGGGSFRYGTQDAASYEECRGGWPELGG